MDMKAVGIAVSKDRLDVHVWPDGIAFAVARDGKGLAELIERLLPLTPDLVIVEATGGFETVVAAALAGAGLPLVAGQDRPDRRRHDRPLRARHETRCAAPPPRGDAG